MGRIKLDFTGENAVFSFNPLLRTEHLDVFFEKYCRKEALRIIPPLVEKWMGITGLKPTKVSYRKAKSRWGSCSGRGNVSLNTALVKLPMECIEYVIVHELCHLKHHNHSKDFWNEVAKYLPDFVVLRKKLKM